MFFNGLLGGGLWWLVRTVFQREAERAFFWATVLAMPLCMTSLRNGNANAHFGGVAVLAIAAMLNRRWWLAVALMALLTAIKPLGVVLLCLAPLVYRPLRIRLPVALLGLALFPFLFARPEYVREQYRQSWMNLQACAVVTEHRFADINGILRTFGTALPPGVSKLVRVVAGALTAGLCWWGVRRLRGVRSAECGMRNERSNEALLSGLWLYALTTGYLMLFNPMNEENSYSIVAPAFGIWGALFLFNPEYGPLAGLLAPGARSYRWLGWVIAAQALTMALMPNIVRPLFGNHFALFWHPLMTLVFMALLSLFLFRSDTAHGLTTALLNQRVTSRE